MKDSFGETVKVGDRVLYRILVAKTSTVKLQAPKRVSGANETGACPLG